MNKQERARQRAREWYQANKQRRRTYERENRLSYRLRDGYRRATRAGVPAEKFTPEKLLEHWERIGLDPLVCFYTGQPLTLENRSIDHLDPLSRPGSTGHLLCNLVPCSGTVNNQKQNKPVHEFVASLGA